MDISIKENEQLSRDIENYINTIQKNDPDAVKKNEKRKTDIFIIFDSKNNEYIIQDLITKRYIVFERNDYKDNENMNGIDEIKEILSQYDVMSNTTGLEKYNRLLQQIEDISIKKPCVRGFKISYDLRYIYDKDEKGLPLYSEQDRKMMIYNANLAKNLGIATVKKNLKVFVMELLEKINEKRNRNINLLESGDTNIVKIEKIDETKAFKEKYASDIKQVVEEDIIIDEESMTEEEKRQYQIKKYFESAEKVKKSLNSNRNLDKKVARWENGRIVYEEEYNEENEKYFFI